MKKKRWKIALRWIALILQKILSVGDKIRSRRNEKEDVGNATQDRDTQPSTPHSDDACDKDSTALANPFPATKSVKTNNTKNQTPRAS